MILIDFNQIMIANIMVNINGFPDMEIETGLVRHMVLNTIRAVRTKFHHEYGEVVICCDDIESWRKEQFPYYKANRKKDRDSTVRWDDIYNALNTTREELANFTPYPVVHVQSAEADDIIAELARSTEGSEKVIIISADKDFVQLQRFPWISQWDPIRERPIVAEDNVNKILLEHIVRGDRGDGIPNILSDDDTLTVSGKRQKKIMQPYLDSWLNNPDRPRTELEQKNYERNKKLIDLSQIPLNIRSAIQIQAKHAYARAQANGRHHLLNYFIDKRLKVLTEKIGEF